MIDWPKVVRDLEAENAQLKKALAEPETEPVTMQDAIAAGDGVLMAEQAYLLRECRAAIDSLIAQKPTLAGVLCGSTTLGNLKASLYDYRPQGVFNTAPPQRQWVGLTDNEKHQLNSALNLQGRFPIIEAIEAKLKEKNT